MAGGRREGKIVNKMYKYPKVYLKIVLLGEAFHNYSNLFYSFYIYCQLSYHLPAHFT